MTTLILDEADFVPSLVEIRGSERALNVYSMVVTDMDAMVQMARVRVPFGLGTQIYVTEIHEYELMLSSWIWERHKQRIAKPDEWHMTRCSIEPQKYMIIENRKLL